MDNDPAELEIVMDNDPAEPLVLTQRHRDAVRFVPRAAWEPKAREECQRQEALEQEQYAQRRLAEDHTEALAYESQTLDEVKKDVRALMRDMARVIDQLNNVGWWE